jgi:hypothetical protein
VNEHEAQAALVTVLSRRCWELAGRESDWYKLHIAAENFKRAFIEAMLIETEKIKGLVEWIRKMGVK